MSEWTIGILGGSGLYDLELLDDAQEIEIDTPWGPPSGPLTIGLVHGVRFVFLPRHGRGHVIAPAAINVRANIDALKRAGCTDLLAISAVGSLREALEPGRFVAVDQIVDHTHQRERSFFGAGLVAHVSVADPVCPRLSALAADAAEAAGAPVTRGATYVAIEGPQFSTRAESRLFRAWGCDVIGMTASPEYRLAREAELPYALVAMVTDYDGWRDDIEAVDAAEIIGRLHGNAATARRLIEALAAALPPTREPSPIDTNLDLALVTAPAARDRQLVARLDAICGRVFAKEAG